MGTEPALLTGPTRPAREPMLRWVVTMALLTPLAALAGAVLGWFLAETAQKSDHDAPFSALAQEPGLSAGLRLQELAPIVTNLAQPPETWVRLQAAILLDASEGARAELVAGQIGEDILGYLRTLSLSSISGASGLRHLREDLGERARIRSGGKVHELVIRALVVQ